MFNYDTRRPRANTDLTSDIHGHEVNMTNGVTPRRWIHCANPALSEIFTKYLGHLDAA